MNTVATAAMAANTIVNVLVLSDSTRKSSIGIHPQRRAHQKLKLIIFFITNTPIDIHTTEAASITRPSGSVHNSEM